MTSLGLRRLSIDASMTFIRQFLGGLCQLGSILLISRILGPEGTGIYSIALLLPMLLTLLLNLGINASNVYFVASKQFTLSHAWIASRNLSLLMIVAGLFVGLAIILLAGATLFPGVDRELLMLAMLIFPSGLMTAIFLSLVQAEEDFRNYNIMVLVQPVTGLLLFSALWLGGTFTLPLAISATVISYLAGSIMGYLLVRRRVDIASVEKFGTYLSPAIRYGVKASSGNIIGFLIYRLDIFLVNMFLGPAATGLYTVAVRLVEQLWMISSAVSTVLLPRLSAMVGDDAGRGALTSLVTRATFHVTLLASGLLAVMAEPLIDILFGSRFQDASIVLFVLLPGVVLISGGRVIANDLAARGRVGLNLYLAILTLVLNTLGNILLIPAFGIIGAAVATSLAYTSDFVVRMIIMHRISRVPWWRFMFSVRSDVRRAKLLFHKRRST
ncbi:flippase [Amorphus sp. MBR-141]